MQDTQHRKYILHNRNIQTIQLATSKYQIFQKSLRILHLKEFEFELEDWHTTYIVYQICFKEEKQKAYFKVIN